MKEWKANVIIETKQLLDIINQVTGFCIIATLTVSYINKIYLLFLSFAQVSSLFAIYLKKEDYHMYGICGVILVPVTSPYSITCRD